MLGVLLLGLLLGLQHALEADHVAAVASLSTGRPGDLRHAARQGAIWGIGHTLTLALIGGSVLLIGGTIGDLTALTLELIVGVMLIGLGIDVLRRMRARRVHFHRHQHGQQSHFHAHSHRPGDDHATDPHQHEHTRKVPLRPLLVGMVHGMAGSAALVVLALGSAQSLWQGLGYIVVFGIGSITGMTALALAISLPLRWTAKSLTLVHNGLMAALGLVTVAVGGIVLQQTGRELLAGLGGI